MSKPIANRKDKILDRALKTFNERGIEYVGLRELAAMLEMRVSNITYYFPTKDDLVFEISKQMGERNSKIIVVQPDISFASFFVMMENVFEVHYEFRCLLRSFVHILSQNKLIADAYKKTQLVRGATMTSNISNLASNGYLNLKSDDELNFLVSTLALISRFWLSESAISAKHMDKEAQMKHYLKLLAQLFAPYATGKGKKELSNFL